MVQKMYNSGQRCFLCRMTNNVSNGGGPCKGIGHDRIKIAIVPSELLSNIRHQSKTVDAIGGGRICVGGENVRNPSRVVGRVGHNGNVVGLLLSLHFLRIASGFSARYASFGLFLSHEIVRNERQHNGGVFGQPNSDAIVGWNAVDVDVVKTLAVQTFRQRRKHAVGPQHFMMKTVLSRLVGDENMLGFDLRP